MARIIFFGNERLATGFKTTCPALTALLKAGHEVLAVVSSYNSGQSGSRTNRELEIAAIAKAHNIPLLLPSRVKEISEQLRSMKADIGILVAFGQIVPESIIEIFPCGIINIHPSLLPLHRGPTPVESVILNGEQQTGVSIMQLSKAMDAGPVYKQTLIDLKGNEAKQQLTERLLNLGSEVLIEILPSIIDGSLVPKPQDDAAATYDRLITKEDGQINWNKSAKQLEREIRAYAEWPKSYTQLAGKDIIITKAHIVPTNSADPGEFTVVNDAGVIMVDTANGSLCIERLKPAGKKEMSAAEFIRGYLNS